MIDFKTHLSSCFKHDNYLKRYIVKVVSLILTLSPCTLAYSQKVFSTSELQSDAKLLWSALNELHPGLYRHSDTATMNRAYNALLSEFSTERNANEAFLYLSEFTSKVKCGHTYLNPFNQNNQILKAVLQENVLLPFSFVIIDKNIIVDKSLDEKLESKSIITHINQIETALILDSLKNYIKADGNRNSKRMKDLEVQLSSKYEYFDYYFPMIYGFKDQVELTLGDGSSKKIQLLTKKDRKTAFSKRFPNSNPSLYDDLWKKEFYEDYAYLQLGTFVTWRLTFDWKEYLDEFFIELEKRGVQNLIIDIRGNEGGLTDATNYLIKKLSKNKGETVFRKPHLAYKKVSDSLKPHVSTWSRGFYNTSGWTKKLNGKHRTIKFSANKPKRIRRNNKAFMGQSYLLVDESNSSATFILAEVCKKNKYAMLVGSETGGTKKGITAGQIFFLTLPNTKIEVDIPLIGRYPLVDMPDEGVLPDILIERSINTFTNNQDAQLEKVVGVVKEK